MLFSAGHHISWRVKCPVFFLTFENQAQNVHVFIFSVTSNKPGLKIKPHLRIECFTTRCLYSTLALSLLVIVAAISVADHGVQRAHSLKTSCGTQKSISLFLKCARKRCYQLTSRERKDSPKCLTQHMPFKLATVARALTTIQGNLFFCFSWYRLPQSLSRFKKLLQLYRKHINIFVCGLSTVNDMLHQSHNLLNTIICPWDSDRTCIWERKIPE